MSDTRPETNAADRYLKCGAKSANKTLFTCVMRQNNFRHALEQAPSQIANVRRCAMMALLCVILFWPAATSVMQVYALKHTQRRTFVDRRIRQSHEADEWQSVA
jgi:hypothetical protein